MNQVLIMRTQLRRCANSIRAPAATAARQLRATNGMATSKISTMTMMKNTLILTQRLHCSEPRAFSSSSAAAAEDASTSNAVEPREVMEYDVVVVGGGPAGLSAAIRLKQEARRLNREVSVCLIEKGAEIGAHILSGNVFETRALDELIPDWKEKGAPLRTEAGNDEFYILTSSNALKLPITPPTLQNHGNYIISLGELCKWLSKQAEELGVDIFTSTSSNEILYDGNGHVKGIATSDMGIGRDGKPKESFTRGIELHSKQLLLAEGAFGNLSEKMITKFNLRQNCDPQTYGIGLKEIWSVPEDSPHFKEGTIIHTIGYPIKDEWFGTFMYHMKGHKILLGTVLGLDYKNPYISPYEEFQQWKRHPHTQKYLENGKCISYGARVISEGGLQAVPKLTFPGGMILGDSAGFLNVPKIKGSHTAMKSGMLAADSIIEALDLSETDANRFTSSELTEYENKFRKSWIYDELNAVRNINPGFHLGFLPWMVLSGLELFITKGKLPFTLHKPGNDSAQTQPAKNFSPKSYPKPDNIYTFDLLTNLQRSGVFHDEDQPSHLVVKPQLSSAPLESFQEFAGPESRFCPARVYEYIVNEETKKPELVINKSNCIHCKTCAIKSNRQFIEWRAPEGGGGPNYENM